MALPEQLRTLLSPIHKDLGSGKCPCGSFANIQRAWIPRIVIGARKGIDQVRLIVVGKNPGHPISEEAARYQKAISRANSDAQRTELLFTEMVAWGEMCHLHPLDGKQGRYHRELMRFIKEALELSNNDAVLDFVYFTELLKCSTENERGRLEPTITRRCMNSWLIGELEILPKVPILALGREVERFLKEISMDVESRTIYLSHPSYGIRNYEGAKQLIKDKYRRRLSSGHLDRSQK